MTGPGRGIELPLRLQYRCGDVVEELIVQRLFRVLPGKRVVGLTGGARQAVVKLFLEPRRWQQHVQRELHGIDAMRRAGVPTAGVISSGTFTGKLDPSAATDTTSGGALLLEFLPGTSVGEAWQSGTPVSAQQLVVRVIGLIARCHHHGLIQKDIHLDNFLLGDEEIFLLDAADIHVNTTASQQEYLENLALFLAQFPVLNDEGVPAYCEHYQRSRRSLSDSAPEVDWQQVAVMVHQARLRRWRIVERKLFRETSAHVCHHRRDRFVIHDRSLGSPRMQEFIENPDAFIARGRLLKDGNSATVAAVEIDGKGYIVKRYNIKNFLHGLRRLLRPSRAWISWRNAHMLQMLGVDTARPCLLMERRLGPLRRQAWFLAEAIPGEDALHALQGEAIAGDSWQNALRQFRSLFRTMQQYQIVHGDMKATNFITTPERLVVLDLDSMRREPDRSRFLRCWERDLRRFQQNWKDPTILAAVRSLLAEVRGQDSFITVPPESAIQE